MKKIVYTLVLCLLSIYVGKAQELERRPAQVSIVPGLSTNGLNAKNYFQPFSFNVLAGVNGGVNGFEMGGLLNVNKEFVKGAQLAGIANVVGGSTQGVQIAGILNLNVADSKSWQLAGIANLNLGTTQKLQMAGIVNMAGEKSSGAQFAGIANVVKGDIKGLQSAGVVNVATGKVKGVQLSGAVNQANQVTDMQMGVLNIAAKANVQIGIVNISDSAKATLGLINIVRRNGYYRGEVWAGETFMANAAFKMGTPKLYTILAAGWRQKDNDYHVGYGIGLGSEIISNPNAAFSLDILTYNLAENKLWTKEGTNNLYQTRLTWARRISGNSSILLGGTFNVLNSNHQAKGPEGSAGMNIAPWNVYNKIHQNRRIAMWPGVNIGFSF